MITTKERDCRQCYAFSLTRRAYFRIRRNVGARKGGKRRTAFQRRCPREFFECPCVMDHRGLIVASGANRGGPFASETVTCRGSRKREHVPPRLGERWIGQPFPDTDSSGWNYAATNLLLRIETIKHVSLKLCFNEGIRLCEKEMILFELFLREIQEYLIEE